MKGRSHVIFSCERNGPAWHGLAIWMASRFVGLPKYVASRGGKSSFTSVSIYSRPVSALTMFSPRVGGLIYGRGQNLLGTRTGLSGFFGTKKSIKYPFSKAKKSPCPPFSSSKKVLVPPFKIPKGVLVPLFKFQKTSTAPWILKEI